MIDVNNKNLTLAITKIGDLLLTKSKDGKAIENVNLTIPPYQRPYKWTAKNAIQLLEDIIEAKNANKEVYRVGTLILHKNDKGDQITYDIVDGQQRTITFALLLNVLGEENIAFLNQKLADNPFNRKNIPNNRNAFLRRIGINKDKIDKENYERKQERESIKAYIENQCELVVVITEDVSEAFQFFDSQNARGKSLYPHDLLKAYHLREMGGIDEVETEKTVKDWESNEQKALASLFGDYLYRIKEWICGNRAQKLDESNIYKFKGVTKNERTPYAQFYKGAFAYADMVNTSAMPFVSGSRKLNAFQLDTPIVAGKPFFDYTRHYFSILKDIQNNNKYEGFYINDNKIVKTLDKYYKKGTGNNITRLLFDTSILLYVDRFCPESYPDQNVLEMFDRFVVYAFIWAYSLRAQYDKLGWLSTQNYILGQSDKVNSFNLYKIISQSDIPANLLSSLADKIRQIENVSAKTDNIDLYDEDGIFINYLHYFKDNNFYIETK